MNVHICDRNTCSTKAVSGPKLNCVECDKECYLLCYGFLKCGENAVKLPLLHGACTGVDPNALSLTCANCDNVLMDDAVAHKIESRATLPKPDQTSQGTQTVSSNVTLARISDDLADLKSVVYDLKSKMDRPQTKTGLISGLLPLTNSNQVALSAKPSFADILRNDRQIRTPKRNKDAMTPTLLAVKKVRPPAKVGTRSEDDNLLVVANIVPKPLLKHSIYVSRVGTSVTLDKMVAYVEKYSNMKKNIDFKCALLVKKGADLNSLTFVSYKIDVTEEYIEQLMQECFWPKGIQIRLFVPKERKSVEVGDFLNLSENEIHHPNKIPRANRVTGETSQSNAEIDQLIANSDLNSDLMDFPTSDPHIKND